MSRGARSYRLVEMKIRTRRTTIGLLKLGGPIRGKQPPNAEGEATGVASGRQRYSIISDGLPTPLPDIEPDETREGGGSFARCASAPRPRGRARARYLMLRLLERAREQQVGVPALRSTDYINSIPPEREPWVPRDEHVSRRIRA